MSRVETLERAEPRQKPSTVPARRAPGSRAPRRLGRRLLAVFALWTILGLGAGILASVSVPTWFGRQVFIVLSGSMEPVLRVGDIVVDRPVKATQLRVGDVVTFKDPEDPKRLITHRIRSIHIRAGRAFVVTKGDASNAVQKWSIAADGRVGRVEYRLPKLGYVLFWRGTRIGKFGVLVVPAALFAVYELWRIWRPARYLEDRLEEEEEEANPG